MKKALDTAEEFANSLFKDYRMNNYEERNRFLEELECKFFKRFKDTIKRLIAQRLRSADKAILESLVKALNKFSKEPNEMTACGSG